MASIESVRASIDANIKTNGRQEITGVVMNAVLNNMVDLSEKNEGTLEEQKTLLNEQSRQIDSLEQKKANEDGKYPELTAGFANNLVGRGEAVDATINFRPSGGTSIEDGAARVKELKGNSVVWNQGFRAADFPDTATSFWYGQHADISIVDGVCRMVATGEGSRAIIQTFQTPFGGTGHKVMIVCDFKRHSSASERFNVYLVLKDGAAEVTSQFFSDINRRREVAFFTLTSGIKVANIYPHLNGAVGDVVDIYATTIYDLTQMFGAGNEPTTIEEFYNRIPQNVDLYAYNEGEVIHTNAKGIKSVGFNAWDEEWEKGSINSSYGNDYDISDYFRSKNYISVIGGQTYFLKIPTYTYVYFWDANHEFLGIDNRIVVNESGYHVIPLSAKYMRFTTNESQYNGDICINLAHSGYRNGEYQPYMQFIRDIDARIKEAFPNGMRSAGNASDKVYNKNGKGIIEKRVGTIEMSRLGWVKTDYGTFTSANKLLDSKQIEGLLNAICSRYAVHNNPSAVYVKTSPDKVFAINSTGLVVIRDDSVTDTTALEAALSGVLMNYELETPEVIKYDEPFNLDYEVWDFGTEQMIATEPSAPIKASIVYGFNAVDSVRTAQLEIAELKTQIAQMQAIMASMTAQPVMIDMPTYNI